MKILSIVGSPRLKGNTDYLVDQALEEAAQLGAQTEKMGEAEKNLQLVEQARELGRRMVAGLQES